MTSDIDALAPERLEVASIDIDAMSTQPIVLPRMGAIESIAVAPLTMGEGRH